MRATRWKRILVLVSDPFAREQLAAAKAAAVARKCKAQVTLLDVFMMPQPVSVKPGDGREQIVGAAAREREVRLARIASRFRFPRTTECLARWGYPLHDVVLDEVRRLKPDILIAESHHRGPLRRMVLANTDWELIRQCPCPLWFTRSAALPARSRWIVAVDPRHTHAKPTRLDDRLIRAARGAVEQLEGAIKLVHVYEGSTAYGSPNDLSVAVNATLTLARRHRIPPAGWIVREGDTVEALATEVMKQHAHVLVIGAVSRSLRARLVIGATAEHVIDQVDCDVFVVKPAGFQVPKVRS